MGPRLKRGDRAGGPISVTACQRCHKAVTLVSENPWTLIPLSTSQTDTNPRLKKKYWGKRRVNEKARMSDIKLISTIYAIATVSTSAAWCVRRVGPCPHTC